MLTGHNLCVAEPPEKSSGGVGGPLNIDLTINLVQMSSIWSNTSALLDRLHICQSPQGLGARC